MPKKEAPPTGKGVAVEEPSLFDLVMIEAAPAEYDVAGLAIESAGVDLDVALAVPQTDVTLELPAEAAEKLSKTDEKVMRLFTEMMAWVLVGPITVEQSMFTSYEPQYLEVFLAEHKRAIGMERMLRAVKFWRDAKTMQPAEVLREGKDLMGRLTDREVCLIMSELSFKAPPSSECYAEYMRAFAFSFGMEMFLQIQGQWFDPINPEHCKQLRYSYSKVATTFPKIDLAEIDAFNREARVAFEARKTLEAQ